MPMLNGLQANKKVLSISVTLVMNLKVEIKHNRKLMQTMLLQIILTLLGPGDHTF